MSNKAGSGITARSKKDDPAHVLCQLSEIRDRAAELCALGRAGKLDHFTVNPEKLDAVAVQITSLTRKSYPKTDVPYHSCWRHFSAGEIDRWDFVKEEAGFMTSADLARSAIDLAVVTVFLTAGSGPEWRYKEEDSELEFNRTEGLSLAAFQMFRMGLFSSTGHPYQVDPEGLSSVTESMIAENFQVSSKNPLSGINERIDILRRLAKALEERKGAFGLKMQRPGNIYDVLTMRGRKRSLFADEIFSAVFENFQEIWPGAVNISGKNMGDVGKHGKVARADKTGGYVPLHRLAQWLTCCLIEPFEWGGISVTGLDELTGLAEYANGGLFVDGGVLIPKDPLAFEKKWRADDEFIIEWRALTVALLDDIRPLVADYLGVRPARFPLVRMMQGGSYQAGREAAFKKRPDGSAPFLIADDVGAF